MTYNRPQIPWDGSGTTTPFHFHEIKSIQLPKQPPISINYTPIISQLGKCLFLRYIMAHILFVLSLHTLFSSLWAWFVGGAVGLHLSMILSVKLFNLSSICSTRYKQCCCSALCRVNLSQQASSTARHISEVLLHSNKQTLIHIFFSKKCKEPHLYCKRVCTFFTIMQSVQSSPYYMCGTLSQEQGGQRLARIGYG